MRYTILTASNGVGGTFTAIDPSASPGPATSSLFYYPNSVVLVTRFGLGRKSCPPASLFNQVSTANVILNPTTSALQTVYNALLIQSIAQVQHDLDALSGALHGSLLGYAATSSLMTGQMLLDQYNGNLERPENCGDRSDPDNLYSCGWNSWFKMRFASGSTVHSFDSTSINPASAGLLFGLDRWLGASTRVGVYGGYNHFAGGRHRSGRDGQRPISYDIGLSASQTLGPWYAMGMAGYGYNMNSTSRVYMFGGYPSTNTTAQSEAQYSGQLFNAVLEMGRAVQIGELAVATALGSAVFCRLPTTMSTKGATA